MALFVVTKRGDYALSVSIVRADSEEEIPPFDLSEDSNDHYFFHTQEIMLLEVEGEKGEVYKREFIE